MLAYTPHPLHPSSQLVRISSPQINLKETFAGIQLIDLGWIDAYEWVEPTVMLRVLRILGLFEDLKDLQERLECP